MEKDSNAVENNGAAMRTTAANVCASPFVAPRDLLLGAPAVMNMQMHPLIRLRLSMIIELLNQLTIS